MIVAFQFQLLCFLFFCFFLLFWLLTCRTQQREITDVLPGVKKERDPPPPQKKTATKVSYLFCYYYFPCVSIKKTEKLNPILSLLAWQYGPVAVKIFNVYKKLVSTLFFVFCLFFFVVEKLEISLDQII